MIIEEESSDVVVVAIVNDDNDGSIAVKRTEERSGVLVSVDVR